MSTHVPGFQSFFRFYFQFVFAILATGVPAAQSEYMMVPLAFFSLAENDKNNPIFGQSNSPDLLHYTLLQIYN